MRSRPSLPAAQQIFEDRRRGERRSSTGTVPLPSDRRQGERRRTLRRYQTIPWWLQINYAEEISSRDVARELRRAEQARRSRDK
ncbi:MAG: hypothetical protein RBS88_01950 [Spongiibacteraceae bacterium]|jgi:hypothetical protein|nr:hypothetical protein [Spongiibacteraceae bacterium]